MVARATDPAGGRAERRADRTRRRGVRSARVLRIRHRDADHRRARGRRRAPLELPHHSLCSPTRACLLTGRNHHRSAMGRVADLAVGFPGYWGKPPRENGYLLRDPARERLRHLRRRQVAPLA